MPVKESTTSQIFVRGVSSKLMKKFAQHCKQMEASQRSILPTLVLQAMSAKGVKQDRILNRAKRQKPVDDGMTLTVDHLQEEQRIRFKIWCIENGVSMKDVIMAMIQLELGV